MKNKICLTLSFLLIAFASCDRSHDDDYLYKTRLQGRWQIKNITVTHYVNSNLLNTSYRTGFTANDYLLFNKDGSGYIGLVVEPRNEPLGTIKYIVTGQDQNDVSANNDRGTLKFKILKAEESYMRIIYKQGDKSTSIADRTYDEYDVNLQRH